MTTQIATVFNALANRIDAVETPDDLIAVANGFANELAGWMCDSYDKLEHKNGDGHPRPLPAGTREQIAGLVYVATLNDFKSLFPPLFPTKE